MSNNAAIVLALAILVIGPVLRAWIDRGSNSE